MKKINLMLFWILLFYPSFGQDTLSSQHIGAHSLNFVIDNENIRGDGWNLIQNAFRSSQFVILRENHFSPLISQLSKVILDSMSLDGFNHFLIETGPLAAKQLTELYNRNESEFQTNLFNFLSLYKLKKGFPPSEFISMKADVVMYKKAIERNVKIVGLDREYYSSFEYLFDKLARLSVNNKDKGLYRHAKKSFFTSQSCLSKRWGICIHD